MARMKKRLKRQLTRQRRDARNATERRKCVKLRWRVKSSVWRSISEGLKKWAKSRTDPFVSVVTLEPGNVLRCQIRLFAMDNLYFDGPDGNPLDVDAAD